MVEDILNIKPNSGITHKTKIIVKNNIISHPQHTYKGPKHIYRKFKNPKYGKSDLQRFNITCNQENENISKTMRHHFTLNRLEENL